jgi:type II secretory pathway component GspD/PulD (secretin)
VRSRLALIEDSGKPTGVKGVLSLKITRGATSGWTAAAVVLRLVITAILAAMLSSCVGQSPPTSFVERQAEEYARSLLSDHRYVEAASFLARELETTPGGGSRVSLLVLLADAQMGIRDLDGVEATLDEAEAHLVGETGRNAVSTRRSRLSELRGLAAEPELAEAAEDLAESSGDATEAVDQEELLVTNSFFETDLRQVLTDLSMETGVPIIWDATVQGLVTFEAIEQPLEDVLRSILLPAGYVYSRQQGTYFVGSPKPEDPAFALLSTTEVVSLSNIDATEAVRLLSDFFKPYVKANATGNAVCITAPQSFVERIRSDLAQMDAPPTQILIEVVVSEIASDALRKIGLDWSFLGTDDDETVSIGTDHTDVEGAAVIGEITSLGLSIGSYSVDLAASLEALVQSGEARIRANPRIATLNGRTAEIGLTRDQYFVIATTTSQYTQYNTLQAVSSGIRLAITPYASPSGEITVHVEPEVGDVVGKGANDLPEINRRTASTTVRVHDGETFTIGGLAIQQENTTYKKVPLLGDIPLLGMLFRYEERSVKDNQIVIFITPRILKG